MPFTTYTCSVQAVTTGSGPESDMVQITTPEDGETYKKYPELIIKLNIPTVPTGPPKLVVAAALSPTVLRINWEPPNVEHRNGVIRRYTINVTELETMYREIFYTEVTNITLSSRHPFYQYRYTVAAETIGFGPFSSSDVIQMPEAGIEKVDCCNNIVCVYLTILLTTCSTIRISNWYLHSQCDLNLLPACVE